MWPRFSNPWWVVAGAVTGLLVCNGPVLGFTFGIFLEAVDRGHGLGPRRDFVRAVVRRHPRGAGGAGDRQPDGPLEHSPGGVARHPLYALFLSLVGLSPRSFIAFTVLFSLAEMLSAIQTPIAYAKAISAWFDRRRGLALGIAMSGVGIGAFVVPQLSRI